jgi:hypothetical protein
MSKRTKALARELHDKGLRRKLAKRVAEALAGPHADAEPPAEVRQVAETLRRLAADIEAGATGEHAEPHASARQAAHPVEPAPKRLPSTMRARPRVRRN